jgi:hypothetical protein
VDGDEPHDPAGYEEVLTAWSWWDCPRAGIALVDGKPHRFCCEFDDDLDEYPDEFRLWPISDDDVETELRFWRLFAEWRSQFDSGARGTRPEDHPGYQEAKSAARFGEPVPADALVAIPHWRLDPNRSFSGRVPRHLVHWSPVDPRHTAGPEGAAKLTAGGIHRWHVDAQFVFGVGLKMLGWPEIAGILDLVYMSDDGTIGPTDLHIGTIIEAAVLGYSPSGQLRLTVPGQRSRARP